MTDLGETNEVQEEDIWRSDVLDRKKYAEFLTGYLIRKTSVDGSQRPFIIALDAKWGAGKTHFINCWQKDLEKNSNHPTFIFDAWKADYHADPLLAFISAFKLAIDNEITDLNLKAEIKAKVNQIVKNGLKKFQSAILPTTKALAIGLANKATYGAIDKISEQLQDGKFDLEDIEKSAIDSLGESLEKCFEKTLEEQAAKEQLFDEFRSSISNALETLSKYGGFELPFFIFIDEIDRCRPSFSIELLESLKHLFDIPGLCFVVSTNLDQLSHSIGGVYGPNFDGRGYLQRFFDAEYSLPSPDNGAFAELLICEFFSEEPSNIYLGLPEKGFLGEVRQNSRRDVLAWVAGVFDMDLRSQRKMAQLIDAAIGSVNSKHPVHFMWLTLLAAIRIKAPELFNLIGKENLNKAQVQELWSKVASNDKPRTFTIPADIFEKTTASQRNVSLEQVFFTYNEYGSKELFGLRNSRQDKRTNIFDYPDTIIHKILVEAPNSYMHNQSYYSSVRSYHELIMCAGHFAT